MENQVGSEPRTRIATLQFLVIPPFLEEIILHVP